jgi:hypothetical protein
MEDSELKQALEHILDDFIRDGKFRIKGIDHTYSDPIVIIETKRDITIQLYLLSVRFFTSFVVPGYRKVAKWMENDKIYLEDVFKVIGIDYSFMRSIVPEDLNEVEKTIKVINDNWPRITEAFDLKHRTSTFLKICEEVKSHSHPEDVMTKGEKTAYIESMLDEYTREGQFKLDEIQFGDGFTKILISIGSNIWIEFCLERCELLYYLLVPGYSEIATWSDRNRVFLKDLFEVIGIDRKVLPTLLAEHLDGIPPIMKAMKNNWPRIVQAFYPEYRTITFKKIAFVRTHGYFPDRT